MDSIEKLIGYYNKSNDDDMYHIIAGHILSNIHEIKNSTIYDLADICYSSPSTISRLMKKMEFESYTDFKSKIHYALENYKYLNQNIDDSTIDPESDFTDYYFDTLISNIQLLRETVNSKEIEKISDYFHQADKVYFYSFPEMQIHILQKALIVSGKKSQIFDSVIGQEGSLSRIDKETVIFALIPNLVEMASMRSVLKKAEQKGAIIITVCSEVKNDFQKYSDLQISFNGSKIAMDLYSFMIITNLIKYDYSTRYVNHLLEELYD